MSDPFTLTYTALWSLAEASELLTSIVRIGNRIRFDPDRYSYPEKDEVSEGDLPELTLVMTGLNGNLRDSSSSTKAVLTYEWIIATGDPSIIRVLMPVTWAVFAAMANWPTIAGSLKWNDKNFIKLLSMSPANIGITNPDQNRGIRGWGAVWGCEVEMHFSTADLIASNEVP